MTAPNQTEDARLYCNIEARLNSAKDGFEGIWYISKIAADIARLKGFVGPASENPMTQCALITEEVGELVKELRRVCVVPEAVAEEIADIIIRTMHLSHILQIDVGAAISDKLWRNLNRPYKHGKAF